MQGTRGYILIPMWFILLLIFLALTIYSGFILYQSGGSVPFYWQIVYRASFCACLGCLVGIFLISCDTFLISWFRCIFHRKKKKILAELDTVIAGVKIINKGSTFAMTNPTPSVITAGTPVSWIPHALTFLEKYSDVIQQGTITRDKLQLLRMDMNSIVTGFYTNGVSMPVEIIELNQFLNDFIMDIDSILEQMKYQMGNAKMISE